MNNINRHGEMNVKPARDFSGQGVDWSDDPRSESAHESHKGLRTWATDDELKEKVCSALYMNDEIDGHNIVVTVLNSVVTLAGSVSSRVQKKEAERAVEKIAFIRDIFNQLEINP